MYKTASWRTMESNLKSWAHNGHEADLPPTQRAKDKDGHLKVPVPTKPSQLEMETRFAAFFDEHLESLGCLKESQGWSTGGTQQCRCTHALSPLRGTRRPKSG